MSTLDDALIDFANPLPNVGGIPLFMLPQSLSKQDSELVTLLHSRGRAGRHLAEYAAFAVDLVPAAHHRLICESIDRLLADEYDDLVICTPPGAAKSSYTSHAACSFFMGRYPSRNIILATHTAELSEKWSRRVRNTLNDNRHQQVFPDSTLSRDSTAVGRWATSAGGEFLAVGVGASILGFRADVAVIDDPVSGFEQAQSITQLQKIHSWFETDLMTRLKPGGKIITICQRLSANDLAGYMIRRHEENPTRRLKVLTLRMVSEGVEDDPLGRPEGVRLWPEWFTPEMVADAQRDEYRWQTLYQQKPPSDDGSWVSTDDIQYRPTPPLMPDTPVYACSDLALSVNKGDYTVHMIVAVSADDSWDIVDASRRRVDPEESSSEVVRLATTYKPREWLIDDDNASKVFIPLIATKARSVGQNVPLKLMPMRGQDKETRAAPLRGQFKRRRVFMPPDAPFAGWLVRELLTFPNALGDGVDDGVDALGLLGRRLAAIARPPAKVVLLKKPTTADMTLDGLWETAPSMNSRRI